MQSLDFGSYGDFQFIFRRNRKCSVTITKFPQNMNMRHICPNGFYQLQMRCFYTLENSTMASIRKAFISYPVSLSVQDAHYEMELTTKCVMCAVCMRVNKPQSLWPTTSSTTDVPRMSQQHTYHQVWAGLQGLQNPWNAESLMAPHSPPLEVSRVKAVQLLNIRHLLQQCQETAICEAWGGQKHSEQLHKYVLNTYKFQQKSKQKGFPVTLLWG